MHPTATAEALSAAAAGILSPADFALISYCDGAHDLAALQAATGLSRADLLNQLEGLADSGMLTARVAPPTGVSRRGLLGGLLGASAVAAVAAGLPRAAAAAPADKPLPAKCYDDSDLLLNLESPFGAFGQDPADQLRLVAALVASGVDLQIEAADASAVDAVNAAQLLADLVDANDALLLEVGADLYLEYSDAAALGDAGPVGRQGDRATSVLRDRLRDREDRAKQGPRESASKKTLASHDVQVVQTFESRLVGREQKRKYMEQAVKAESKDLSMLGAVTKARDEMEAKAKDSRFSSEMKEKERQKEFYADKASAETISLRIKRLEEATKKKQQYGNQLDARQLDGGVTWVVSGAQLKLKNEEESRKEATRDYLQADVDRGTSVQLRQRSEEHMQKRVKVAQEQQKKMAKEMNQKQI
jgi:hypothetical protein